MKVNLKDIFSGASQMDEKVMLRLLQAIAEMQTSDFDYLRFKHSYLELQKMGMDEATAAKSAYITASTVGLTKSKLLESIDNYKVTLNKEREEFAQALKNQIATNIDSRNIKIKELQDKHAENQRKLDEITKQQDIITAEVTRLSAEADAALVKINDTRDKFKVTFDYLYNEMEEDKNLYTQILS
jgi:chromosome segregation ATPase